MIIEHVVSIGFEVLTLDFSPIKGPEGNIEYLIYIQNHTDGVIYSDVPVDVQAVVDAAHETL